MITASTSPRTIEPPFQFTLGGLFRFMTACCLLAALLAAALAYPGVLQFVGSMFVIALFLLFATVLVWLPIFLLSFAVAKLLMWTFGIKRSK